MQNGILELLGMEFHAFHGCLDFEKKEGNTFIVDFKAELDMTKASENDSLEDTIDYSIIYNIIKEEMEIPSDLIEHVAGRILRRIEKRFPEIAAFSVSVSKRNPPVDGPCNLSKVTLFHGEFSR